MFFMGHSVSLLYGFCDDDALLLYNMSTYLTILLACLLTYLLNYFKFAHTKKIKTGNITRFLVQI